MPPNSSIQYILDNNNQDQDRSSSSWNDHDLSSTEIQSNIVVQQDNKNLWVVSPQSSTLNTHTHPTNPPPPPPSSNNDDDNDDTIHQQLLPSNTHHHVDIKQIGRRLWKQHILTQQINNNNDNNDNDIVVVDDNGTNGYPIPMDNIVDIENIDTEDDATHVVKLMKEALAQIRILDYSNQSVIQQQQKQQQQQPQQRTTTTTTTDEWLKIFNGQLTSVPVNLIETLRQRAPSQFSARVADFNDNLFYHMQEQRGINHLLDDTTLKFRTDATNERDDDEKFHRCNANGSDDVLEDPSSNNLLSTLPELSSSSQSSSTSSLGSSSSSSSSSAYSTPFMESSSLESSVRQFEEFLSADEYLGSFLTTESTVPQPSHVDYTWEILEEHCSVCSNDGNTDPSSRFSPSLMIGFMPLTKEGMFLQVWPKCPDRDDTTTIVEGELIFIPYGNLLLLPADTIHGGGFRTSTYDDDECGRYGNLRFHLYVARNGARLPEHQTNKYTEPNDRRKELCDRYIDAPYLTDLLDGFFT